jgi:hypothetical protein
MYYIEHPEDSFKAISHLINYAKFQRSFSDSAARSGAEASGARL